MISPNAEKLAGENNVVWKGLFAASGDVGDLSTIIPTVQMAFGGYKGTPHGNTFTPVNENAAYILPAKILACTIVDLLFDEEPKARKIKNDFKPEINSKEEYIGLLNKLRNGE